MKCKYCNKELPEVINGSRDICDCEKANKEHYLQMNIAQYKQHLIQLNKQLKDLEK